MISSLTDNRWLADRRFLWLMCGIVALMTVLAYRPGLAGPFLFDDFGSLAKLGDMGGIRDLESFKAFVFGGIAGPSGRPVALLTFLIDATNWPADAFPFKRTNLVIHLINGMLLGILTYRILTLVDIDADRARWLALTAAALWLLHPFLVSTTLYAVQRMAQLATLFVFLGMLLYLVGRAWLPDRPRLAYSVMSASVVICTLLATLCKENGILLPFLIGILEWTVGAATAKPARSWIAMFIVAPSLALFVYLGTFTMNGEFFARNEARGLSVYERLLTETRVLVDYLRHWFAPSLYTSGVFQDHYLPSRSFTDPVTTVLSAILHAVVIGTAIAVRKRWPVAAFAVLFFYGAHVMESTVINLELYFEHRNYLAAAFLLLPVVVGLQALLSRPLFLSAVAALLALFTSFTYYSANVWSSYPTIVEAAAKAAPTSARAQQQWSQLLYQAQDYAGARRITSEAMLRLPDNANLHLHHAVMECQLGNYSAADFERMSTVLSSQPYDLRSVGLYESFVTNVSWNQCGGVSVEDTRDMFVAMLAMPVNADPGGPRLNQIKFFEGVLNVHLGNPSRAVDNFNASLDSRPDPSRAMRMAAQLASGGYLQEALAISETALSILRDRPTRVLTAANVRESDIHEFQELLRTEMQQGPE